MILAHHQYLTSEQYKLDPLNYHSFLSELWTTFSSKGSHSAFLEIHLHHHPIKLNRIEHVSKEG